MDSNAPVERYDALVIGGGPAGLSAAICLARACRSVVIFECERPGRSDWSQVNRNYVGFPDGISIGDLCARGREQAERFGATFIDSGVAAIYREEHGFAASAAGTTWHARAVILATGVEDRWARFPGYEAYIGRTMHWCIHCDGYEMRDKRVVVAGNDEQAAEMAIQMLAFQPKGVTLLTNDGALGIRHASVERVRERGIRVNVGRITETRSRQLGHFEALILESGEEIPLDHLFSAQGAEPNTALARSLGVDLTSEGYIKVDSEARTSVPSIYAAGDVTRLFAHQVVTAAHEGATAAHTLAYELHRTDSDAVQTTMAQPAGGDSPA